MNTRVIEEANTRRELVLMYLKENDGKLLTASAIAEGIGENVRTVANDLRFLKNAGEEIHAVDGHGYVYGSEAPQEPCATKAAIIDLLRSNPGRRFKGTEIGTEIGAPRGTVSSTMIRLKEQYPQIKSLQSRINGGYWWEEEEPAKEEPVPKEPEVERERYPETKNDEGYSDPTAYQAMKSVRADDHSGEVWTVMGTRNSDDLCYILATKSRCCLALKLIENYSGTPIQAINFVIDGVSYTADAARVISFSTARLRNSVATYDETEIDRRQKIRRLQSLRRYICEGIFGVSSKIIEKRIEVPVEKIVEKRVEVPVERVVEKEKVVEVPVKQDDGELVRQLEMIKRERDIYKDILDRLLPTVVK